MLTIEEYIRKRKKEDCLNEFSYKDQSNNLRTCVNYVFEYFNNYLKIDPEEESTILKDKKVNDYYKYLNEYDVEIREWLVEIYREYNSKVETGVKNFVRNRESFYLLSKDAEFNAIAYEFYAAYQNTYKFLQNDIEKIFPLIKEYWRVHSQSRHRMCQNISICPSVTEWIDDTWKKNKVSIWAFARHWIEIFDRNKKLWPALHKIKVNSEYRYNCKVNGNLFGIDDLYRKIPKTTYTRGKKQEMEIVLMYIWTKEYEDDEEYWEKYFSKVIVPFENSKGNIQKEM